MQIRATKRDVLWSYVGTVFRMGSLFFLLPIILSYLSDESLGLWYVFQSVYSFVTLFQSGFVPTFGRNMAYCWSGASTLCKTGVSERRGEVNPTLFASVIKASSRLYRGIALAMVIVLVGIGTWYIGSITIGMPKSGWLPAWVVFCVAVFLNMNYSYYESLLRGVGNLQGVNKATVASSIAQMLTSAVLLVMHLDLTACAVGFLVQGLAFRSLCRLSFFEYHNVRELYEKGKNGVTKKSIGDVMDAVMGNAIRDTFVSLANYAATTATTIVSSIAQGLAITASYSMTMQLVNAIATIAAVTKTAYQPAMQSAIACGDTDEERNLVSRVFGGYSLIYLVGIVGLCVAVLPIIVLIRPSYQIDWLLLAILSTYVYLWQQHSIAATCLSNHNSLPYVRAFVVSSVLGLIMTVVMARCGIGVYSLVLGPFFVQLAYNNWHWPNVVARRFGTTFLTLHFEGIRYWVLFIELKMKTRVLRRAERK